MSKERPTKCRHFNGIQNKSCEVGVVYRYVARPDSHPIDLPCFSEQGCTQRCSQVSYYTPEELTEQDREAAAAIKAYLEKLAAHICPHCDTPIQEERQVGRCVYAVPCGHRLYQGKAKKPEKLHPYLQEQLDRETSHE